MLTLNSGGDTQFIEPIPALRRYVTSYFFFGVETPGGKTQEDLIHPEWASVHYTCSGQLQGCIVPEALTDVPLANLVGPTTRARRLLCSSVRIAGFGLQPLGWFRLCRPSANTWANRYVDVTTEPAFALFERIWHEVKRTDDPETMAQIFDRHLSRAIGGPEPREAGVEALHSAITNPEIDNVVDLAAAVGLDVQQVERLTRRAFGFPPKRLLRRQRFLRTMAQRLLQPDTNWGDSLDDQYFDQAQFVRDFREFMGMSPSEYLAMPRPISKAATLARAQQVGQPLQALQRPKR